MSQNRASISAKTSRNGLRHVERPLFCASPLPTRSEMRASGVELQPCSVRQTCRPNVFQSVCPAGAGYRQHWETCASTRGSPCLAMAESSPVWLVAPWS
jgi:hypothetical protein